MKYSKLVQLSLLALCLVSLSIGLVMADDEKPEAEEVTLTGEVLDLYCYMKHPDKGQGTEHAKCANSCIKRGLPIGFMSDGVVYLIIGTDHKSAAEMVAGMAGRPTQVTGVIIEYAGIKSIEITGIKEAGDAPKKEEDKG